MADYIFPSNRRLTEVAQEKMIRLQEGRLGFQIMPMVDADAALVEWEQQDNYTGLQHLRGINGEPTRVNLVGDRKYSMQPGYYGEFKRLDEKELTQRRQLGDPLAPISVTDLVMRAQDHLLQRRLDRVEYIIWQLVSSGQFVVAGDGGLVHTDAYALQTFASSVPWSTVATATPLADMRAVQLLHRGRSVNLGAQAQAVMNRTTFNTLLGNQNDADLKGSYSAQLASTVLSQNAINVVLASQDLPQIVIYDEGYLDENGDFQLFIPNDTVIVVGQRPAGQRVGEYLMTRNANNAGMAPGPYMKVFDHGNTTVPRCIDVHDGHNGGPAIYYPSAIVRMDVG